MKAIETVYNGYRFRSRLEARWATLFDTLGIKYDYEPEGFVLSDGTYYLPDFYLPESRSWFEVKGEMDEASAHKIDEFIKEGNWYDDGPFDFAGSESSWLCECRKCGKKYFAGQNGSWRCPCCGAYDGDGHFTVLAEGDPDRRWYNSDEFERAVNAAKRARFEHKNIDGKRIKPRF